MSQTAVIVSDAHLDTARDAGGFHRFLAAVPDLGTHLVVNGDLFEFWFEFRHVIPRAAFPTLAALERVRRAGVALTVMGGNHDRWSRDFWREELDAAFHPRGARLDLAGHVAWVAHGDGLTDRHAGARLLHWLTGRRLTTGLFRWLHPDVGLPLVRRLAHRVADHTRDPAVLEAAADAQAAFARRLLDEDPILDLVVLSHTHRPALERVDAGRWYLNPGAWMDGGRYAIVGPDGPVLQTFAPDG